MNIIMMHGLPGTGKSFVAQKIAERFPNSIVLKTVQFRHDTSSSSVDRFDENNPKTRREKDDSYKLLCEAARVALEKGKTPILDGTFHKKYRREWVYQIGSEMKANIIVVSTTCEESVVFDRLKHREKQENTDAFLKSKEAYELLSSQQDLLIENVEMIKVDSSKGFNVDALIGRLQAKFK